MFSSDTTCPILYSLCFIYQHLWPFFLNQTSSSLGGLHHIQKTHYLYKATRQPPTALVVITETTPHDGPMGQRLRLLIFTRADRPDSCKMYSNLPTISKIFSSPAYFHTSVVSNLHLHPLKGPKLLDYKRVAVCHAPNCQYHRGFGVSEADSGVDCDGTV